MPYFTKRLVDVPDAVKKRTEYQLLKSEISNKLTNNFVNMPCYREHKVLPIQSQRASSNVEEQKNMEIQENYSRMVKSCQDLKENFEKRLREAGHPDIYNASNFIPIYLKGKKDAKQALDELCLSTGLHNFISIPIFCQLESQLQSVILNKIVEVLQIISVDMQIYMLYHFFS